MITPWLLLFLFFVAVFAAFLFTGFESATLAVNHQSLRRKLDKAGEKSDRVFMSITNAQRALAVGIVGVNLSLLISAAALHFALREFIPPNSYHGISFVLTIVIMVPIYLLMTDVMARFLARRRAAGFLLATRVPLSVSSAVMVPFLNICSVLTEKMLSPFGVERASFKRQITIDELIEMIGRSEQRGSLEASERKMMQSAIDLEQGNAREAMQPLIDVAAVKVPEFSVAAAIELARQTGYSRFPVYRREIIKMNEYVDVATLLADADASGSLEFYLRRALVVPETMRIDVLLRTFTEARQQCAIVIDESGSSVGWVTREDVLEEIVGDIGDRDGDKDPECSLLDDGSCLADARIDLDDLNEKLDTHLMKGEDFDTLAGWLYSHIGRVPLVGEYEEEEGVLVTVLKMEDHRIVQASINKIISDQ